MWYALIPLAYVNPLIPSFYNLSKKSWHLWKAIVQDGQLWAKQMFSCIPNSLCNYKRMVYHIKMTWIQNFRIRIFCRINTDYACSTERKKSQGNGKGNVKHSRYPRLWIRYGPKQNSWLFHILKSWVGLSLYGPSVFFISLFF